MNAIQHTPAARLADLNPLLITVETCECLAPVPGVARNAKRDSGYGCVDWYQYRVIERLTHAGCAPSGEVSPGARS